MINVDVSLVLYKPKKFHSNLIIPKYVLIVYHNIVGNELNGLISVHYLEEVKITHKQNAVVHKVYTPPHKTKYIKVQLLSYICLSLNGHFT